MCERALLLARAGVFCISSGDVPLVTLPSPRLELTIEPDTARSEDNFLIDFARAKLKIRFPARWPAYLSTPASTGRRRQYADMRLLGNNQIRVEKEKQIMV
ncbi:hypothetical protein EVAR_38592_1 [Eumeta japonica]|uniref:Uncharacterized protein n=1 Tax=Eumeta variegata TaxID=151549 RepID=A0A4C1WRZ9_EUMVA|nr:hypothetical protein EVAR_38592_1 [Eumeta japonica]